ncbi:carbohydrate ABC transporter permease [Vallitalea okinawensis]|uniref:carbohydrate ABC transporter permease n=1 Tax=Vallitalea okinawensis TaxID=2078660 RepID=UPI002FE5E3DA
MFHLLLGALAFTMLYPILWLLASSFKNNAEIFGNASSLIPDQWEFTNYIEGWKGFGGISFGRFFANTFFIVITSTIAQVLSSSVVAFGFSRIKFVGRKIFFACMILTLMLPNQVLIIPQYILFSKLGWLNTYAPLILPSFFGVPFFIFMIIQFIYGIPKSLDESAKIDGCGKIQIFGRIIFPLLKPALITSAIFSFYWKWQEFLAPLLYLQNAKKYPVSLALKMFADPNSVSNWGAMFAMSVLSLVPPFALFIIFQRYLVDGISTTGIK